MTQETTDPDQLLDALQKAISMIRTHGNDMDEQCSEWESRLYAWHDFILELTAKTQEEEPDNDHPQVVLEGEDAKRFLDIHDLQDEITSFGNQLFRQSNNPE